ncbi:NAD-dependent epimerase/dehydratase family protein [Paenibacillus sp. Leaf72]|uniref:NAD-dependent epimerase/dehydratase family protein n=1 Tax=Paenibacillus sp. Leaf72 TaxID=1736234 RepID=UPI0006F8C341|nr:NAD(P)-dependent oxidoreductase [Paenibacillus sp. Leaf72]KQO15376.1 nucleoside-diphosphate sugar epimerase [Paenibacillus sp. Leaf72]
MSKNKTVLVTGAGGYIGRYVVEKLLDMGIEVIAVGNNTSNIDLRANIIEYNIFSDNDNVYEKLGSPDICLHMAWTDGFVHNAESHLKYMYSHYQFIKKMLEGGLKQISVMGTMHEIGYHEGEINENTPALPYSFYGVAKNSLRQSLEILLKDREVVFQWLRAFYIYGDDSKNKSIFTKIIQAEQEGKEKFPFTSGKNMYDFITVDELAEQIVLSVLQSEINGVINCCSGSPISLQDMVESFLLKNEFKIKLEYGAFPDRPYDSPAIWGNNEKIQKILQNTTWRV